MEQRIYATIRRPILSLRFVTIFFLSIFIYYPRATHGQQDTIPPTAPREVNARPRNSTTVELFWFNSVDNAGVTYRIYRNVYSNPILVGTADSSGLERIAFVDSNLSPNTTYNYGVSAIDPSGNESSITSGITGAHHSDTRTPPAGYTINTQVFYPDTVAPGGDIVIQQIITNNPAGTLGHHDIHWDSNMDFETDNRTWFPSGPQSTVHDNTVTITAPSTPGNFYFMDDGHLWDNGWNNEAHKEGAIFRIIVTQGNPLVISPQQLAAGQFSEQYTQQLTVSGEGTAPFFWGVTQGRLPSGLLLDANTGVISGTTSEAGLFQFKVMVEGINGVTAFRDYQLNIDQTVPVELVNFEVNATENNVELSWETATETNNFGFEIERKILSLNGEFLQEWDKFGFVKGHGTTTEPHIYSYVDNIQDLKQMTKLRLQYRLKQIDLDGTFEYHNAVEVTIGEIPESLVLGQNYPNPFNPETTIEFAIPEDGLTTLKVYNIMGQEVATLVNEFLNGGVTYKAEFKASSLSSGIYIYVLSSNNTTRQEKKKMILLK